MVCVGVILFKLAPFQKVLNSNSKTLGTRSQKTLGFIRALLTPVADGSCLEGRIGGGGVELGDGARGTGGQAPPGERTASLPQVLAPKWRQTFSRHHLRMFINDVGSQSVGGSEAQRGLLVVIHINGERPPVFHCHVWQLTSRPPRPHFGAPPLLSSLHDFKLHCVPLKDLTQRSAAI